MTSPPPMHPSPDLNRPDGDAPSVASGPAKRSISLRWHLTLLVASLLLPITLVMALIIARAASEERDDMERQLMSSADLMANDLDREILADQSMLLVLSQNTSLDSDDFADMKEDALGVLQSQPTWKCITIWSPDRKLLLDTDSDNPIALVAPDESESLQHVIETQKPAVGAIVFRKRYNCWTFTVRVPVVRRGQLQCVLSAAIDVRALDGLVELGAPGFEMTRAIVDSNLVIAARSKSADRFVGTPALPSFQEHALATTRNFFPNVTREGEPVYIAQRKAPLSGWWVGITAPREYIEGPVRKSLLLTGAAGTTAIVLSMFFPWIVARRIERDIASIAEAARTLAKDQPIKPTASRVSEIAALDFALRQSSDLLRKRSSECDEHLSTALAAGESLKQLNETLEERVNQRTALANDRAEQLRRLAAELSQAEHRERQRLSHILHEHFQQILAAARLRLTLAMSKADPHPELNAASALLSQAVEEARSLAVQLSPPVLHELGLAAGLKWLGRSMMDRHGLEVEVDADDGNQPLSQELKLLLFHGARELLYNVVKHAGVLKACLTLRRDGSDMLMIVEDCGAGVREMSAQDRTKGGLGLFGLRERLAVVGGDLQIDTSSKGVSVRIKVPVEYTRSVSAIPDAGID